MSEKTEHPTRRVPSRFPRLSTRVVRAYRTSRGTEIARARVAGEPNDHYEADAPPVPTRVVERAGHALDLPTRAIHHHRGAAGRANTFVILCDFPSTLHNMVTECSYIL